MEAAFKDQVLWIIIWSPRKTSSAVGWVDFKREFNEHQGEGRQRIR